MRFLRDYREAFAMKKPDKKTVTVRKSKGSRTGVCIFMVGGMFALSGLLAQNAYTEFVILCAPFIVLLLAILLYFATWKILFTADRVIKKVFFVTLINAPYYQIKDVTSARYTSLNCHVRIVFENGGQIVFQREDENADKALNKLLSHHSVRNI